jgi:hypothetical protein
MYSKKAESISRIADLFFYFVMRLDIRDDASRRWILSILFFAGIVIVSIAKRHASAGLKVEQEQRDRLAQKLAGKIESEILSGTNISPFVLYLRPFALEKAIRERQGRISLWQILLPHMLLTNLLFHQKANFDLKLQTYLDRLGIMLISIGYPNNKEGAGRIITTDSTWRERFQQLAERATTIVVVPGYSEGVISEIRWLKGSGLLVNAIFFKPASYPRADWQKMKKLYEQEEDIEIPDYSPKQLSFRMYPSGRCYDVLKWRTAYRRSKMDRGEDQMRALLTNKRIEP